MVPLRKLILALAVLTVGAAMIGCGDNHSEKLPDPTVVSPEARIKEIESSNMPPMAKQAAIARIQSEAGNSKGRGNK